MEEFLKSYDFMKIGQAIAHENYQLAAMTANRMLQKAKELGSEYFIRQLTAMRQCIAARNKKQAQNILALMVNKRAQLIKEISDGRTV